MNKAYFVGLLIVIAGAAYIMPFSAHATTNTATQTTTVNATVPSTASSGGCSGNCGINPPPPPPPPPPPADTIPPSAINSLAITQVADTSVGLQWTAPGDDGNIGTAAIYVVKYSANPISSEADWNAASAAGGNVPSPAIAGTVQSMTVTGLASGATYYFGIRAIDKAGNQGGLSNSPSATTVSAPVPPVISNVKATAFAYSATIAWNTDVATDGTVAYGSDSSSLTGSAADTVFQTAHSLTLSELVPNTTYYFAVRSANQSGSFASSDILSFVTHKTTLAPPNVSQFTIQSADRALILSWKKPNDASVAGTLVKRGTFTSPQTPSEGTTVYSGSAEGVTDANLQNGATYYYTAFAYATSGQYASGVTAAGAPTGPILPPPPPTVAPPPPPVSAGANSPAGIAPPAQVAPSSAPALSGAQIQNLQPILFLGANESLVLPLNSDGSVHILAGQNITLKIPQTIIPGSDIYRIEIQLNGNTYLAQQNPRTSLWQATIQMPEQGTALQGMLDLYTSETQKQTRPFAVTVEPYGLVYADGDRGPEPLADATVTLFAQNSSGVWVPWDSSLFNQKNPSVTDQTGRYGFMAPAGTYFYRVEKDGFHTFASNQFVVADTGIIRDTVHMLLVPPPLLSVIKPGAPISENIQRVAKNLGQKSVYLSKLATQQVQKFVQNPNVQKTAEQVAAPAAVGVAAVNVGSAIGLGQLLPYLRFLFTQPFLFFGRRRRKSWGVVYNSLTKLPIALATVRLLDAESGRILQSRVTDAEGRYAFLVKKGAFKLAVFQNNFIFPSAFLHSMREDNQYLDVYHGESIAVQEGGALLTANIPLDPVGEEKPVVTVLRQALARKAQNILGIASMLSAFIFLAIKPSMITGILAAVQIAFYALFRRLALPKKPKSWGIVYDEDHKEPLGSTVARIFDVQYNKLLETQVTDKKGRYSFLVGKNKYYVIFERPHYERKTSDPIDASAASEPVSVVAFDVNMKKQSNKESG